MICNPLHLDVQTEQRWRWPHRANGDVVQVIRNEQATTVILCDGVGSGTFAFVAARLAQARLARLLEEGFSFQQAFLRVAATMESYKDPHKPYAAIAAAHVHVDGRATALRYHMPPLIWLSEHNAYPLPTHPLTGDGVCVMESVCHLRAGEGLLMISDGIAQAGMPQLNGGWQSQGVAEFASHLLEQNQQQHLLSSIQQKAAALNEERCADDATVVWLRCRPAKMLTILTGLPQNRLMDMALVERFMEMPGKKVVCGATTAAAVARILGRTVHIENHTSHLVVPPNYHIDGIDLATEGAVTLNQLNNILDIHIDQFDEQNPVTELYDLVTWADRIYFLVGSAKNPANDHLYFTQCGVLNRQKVVSVIAEKLKRKGKTIVVETT